MCRCIDVEFGTYEAAVPVATPEFMRGKSYGCYHVPEVADIDECILPQIEALWAQEIITTGCCCGHNKTPPTVTVAPECVDQMEALGFNRWFEHGHIFLLEEQGNG